MRPVRIFAKDPAIDITIPMGDGPAVITAGLGGWGTVERQDDLSVTDWDGQEPLAQDVPLLLDGYDERESMEREWNTVKKLGRDASGDERKPPVFKVFGPVEYPGKAWVLPDNGIEVDADSIIKRPGDGELQRIAFTLHLLEYIRPDALRRRKKGGRKMGLGQAQALTYKTRQGDTLVKIAAAVFGNWKRWQDIGKLNSIKDPNRVLPTGRELRLP